MMLYYYRGCYVSRGLCALERVVPQGIEVGGCRRENPG